MKQKVSIQDKIAKDFPEFVEAVVGLSATELDARLVQNAKDSEANEQAKEADEELEKARENVSFLAAPYQDARKALRLKARYLIQLLKDKGSE